MKKSKWIKGISIALVLAICIGTFITAKYTGEVSVNAAANLSKVTGKVMKITKKRNATEEGMISGYNGFSLKAFKEVLADAKEGENVMISPASLMFALDMASVGANGKTFKQMASLIYKGATKRDLVSFANSYRKMLEKSGIVSIANSIWINEDNLNENNVKVNEEYLNFVRKYFKAATDAMSFDNAAKTKINNWISEKTDGMIKDAVDKLDKDTIMLIINALAFEGEWEKEYDQDHIDENGSFTNYQGINEIVKMLSSTEGTYLSSDTAQGFLKYYKGGKYAFMAMLPDDENVSINDYVKNLDEKALEEFYNSARSIKVITKIPAFSFDYSIVMNNMLQKLGMKEAFKYSADFKKMLDPETISNDIALYIGSVIQKTHIELDEKGTKAAAVTIIDMKCTATAVEPVEEIKTVILDRPFIFAIMDTETGTPVFIGTVNTIK